MSLLEMAKSAAATVRRAISSAQRRSCEEERRRRQRLIEDEEITRTNLRRRLERNRYSSVFLGAEKARSRRFVGVAFRGPENDRRAWVPWAGLDIWEIVEEYHALGRKRLLEEMDISEKALDLALAYYELHSEEIDRKITENREVEEEWRSRHPELFFPLP